MTDVISNKIIDDLNSLSKYFGVDDENVFMNMISEFYLTLFRIEIIAKEK